MYIFGFLAVGQSASPHEPREILSDPTNSISQDLPLTFRLNFVVFSFLRLNFVFLGMESPNDIRHFLHRLSAASEDIGTAKGDSEALNMMLEEISASAPMVGSIPSVNTECMQRDLFRQKWGFSVPSRKAVLSIARFAGDRTILDIGCGRGTWSALLALAGCRVESYDSFDDGYIREEDCLVHASVGDGCDILASRSRESDVLLLSWPPYWNDLADSSLQSFKGNRLVYIGEEWGGCTATDEFFNLLDKDWKLSRTVKLNNFSPIQESVFMYRRQI